MNVLIDTNIALDVILQREPWLVEAAEVWASCETGLLHGHLQASVTIEAPSGEIASLQWASYLQKYIAKPLRSLLPSE